MRILDLFIIILILFSNFFYSYSYSYRYITIGCQPNEKIVISLTSLSTENINITYLPTIGNLYQTSPIFETYGYLPYSSEIINSTNNNVNSPTGRVVYLTSPNFEPTYFYFLSYSSSYSYGKVRLTLPDFVTIQSQFWTDNEGWFIQTAIKTPSTWSPTSINNGINYFIYGGDFDPVVGYDNNVRWYFSAPLKFLGNHGYLYGGYIQFWLGSFAGDFTYLNNIPYDFIQIRGGDGTILSQRYVTYKGNTQFFNFTMNEYSGWFKDPKNNLIKSWSYPTKCEMVNVLSNITEIRVYGDVTNSFEVIGMDSFRFVSGSRDDLYVC